MRKQNEKAIEQRQNVKERIRSKTLQASLNVFGNDLYKLNIPSIIAMFMPIKWSLQQNEKNVGNLRVESKQGDIGCN